MKRQDPLQLTGGDPRAYGVFRCRPSSWSSCPSWWAFTPFSPSARRFTGRHPLGDSLRVLTKEIW